MFAGFLLSLREGLEAALIVGVLLGALDQLDLGTKKRTVWLGVSVAVLMSIAAGFGLRQIGASFEGRAEEIFEGFAMLTAAAMLTWMIFWMQSHSRSLTQKLKKDIKIASNNGNGFALFSLSFLSVFREGVELALFLLAASINGGGAEVLWGSLLGLISIVLLSFLIFRGLVRMDVSKFFQVTSVILVIFAAGLVAHGVHELNEAGLVPEVIAHVWDVNHLLDERSTLGEFLKTLVGYNGNPSLTEVLSYLLFVGFVTGFVWKDKNRDREMKGLRT